MSGDWQKLLAEASQLRRAGRVEEAISAYERLLAVRPDLGDSWYNLGWLQKQARAFEDSLLSYARALDAGVSGAEDVHLNRAVILSDHLHRPDEARAELDQALALAPDHVPSLLNLGNWHEDHGQRDDARKAYQRVLQLKPGHPLALARLAGVSHSAKLDEALADQIRTAIVVPGASAAERADLGFALGGMLDAAGQYAPAFEAIRAANADSREAGGPAARYNRAATEAMIDRIIAAFPTAASKGDDDPDLAPIFICGLFRSGSTLAERILATSDAVSPAGELDLIPALAHSISEYPDAAGRAPAETVERWRDAYLGALRLPPSSDKRVTDKRPDNFLYLGLIKKLFPAARIIHTRRDRLDNMLSLYFLHLDPAMSYALDLGDLAHWHGQYSRLMAHWGRLYGADMLTLDYDALVRDPDTQTRGLFEFCGLPWDSKTLEFHQRAGPVKTASVWQVREPLYARASGRAANYRHQLERFGQAQTGA